MCTFQFTHQLPAVLALINLSRCDRLASLKRELGEVDGICTRCLISGNGAFGIHLALDDIMVQESTCAIGFGCCFGLSVVHVRNCCSTWSCSYLSWWQTSMGFTGYIRGPRTYIDNYCFILLIGINTQCAISNVRPHSESPCLQQSRSSPSDILLYDWWATPEAIQVICSKRGRRV